MAFAKDDGSALPLHLVGAEGLDDWKAQAPASVTAWLDTLNFKAAAGEVALVPGEDGALGLAVAGLGSARDRARSRFTLGGLRSKLPARSFVLHHDLSPEDLAHETLGWCLAGYAFQRFRNIPERALTGLVAPDTIDAAEIETLAAGEALTRDLINTPASHMGPEELESAMRALAETHGGKLDVTTGEALLTANLPLIHAVGRASTRAPRLLDLRWGDTGPKLTLVGKGVCFDTGGLNLKPGASMGLMKKDMGGAATVLGLAQMIMARGWPVRLRVLIPAVENAVSGNAMRPGDILPSRKGLSVEINNTDAEGRLVLADALTLADEETPDIMVCMATLTGAARVALGPDVPPFFTRDAILSDALLEAANTVQDPLWPLPLHPAYEALIEPGIADLDNAPSGGMAGAITAALFLHRFVEATPRFVHFDIYGYQPKPAPARPKGGVGQGARALYAALPRLLDL
ncbi:MAG: leucyl aminopeptidase family protein [Rhodobacteraceae bacterium]|nr:MAG: leucyl aminopeptidase family protein [Paracoccaceae bacterium]